MTPPPASVHVVDDDAPFRESISRVLALAGFDVRQHSSAGDFLLANIDPGIPGCVLLDVHMPGPSGLDLHEAMVARGESLPVIFITGRGDIPTSVRAMKAGAVDFLTKPVERSVLLEVVKSAIERQRERTGQRHDDRALLARYETLTARERDVLVRVVAGKRNKQIADQLRISERTVKIHRAHAMEKLGAGSLAELVRMALRLPDPPPVR
jgi:FixJ family two-component response regulator